MPTKPKMLRVDRVLRYHGRVTKAQGRQRLVTHGGIQAIFYDFDMARLLKCLFAGLTFGNMGAEIRTYVRNGNSEALYRVDSVNTVDNEND